MLYASYDQMLSAKGEDELRILTDREDTDAPNPQVALSALEDASRTIDGYLTHKYALPLSSVPAFLRRPCIDIAVYYLAGTHASLTDDIEKRYEAAIKLLEQIAKGMIGLGLSEPQAAVPEDADGSDNVIFDAPPERVMTRDRLRSM